MIKWKGLKGEITRKIKVKPEHGSKGELQKMDHAGWEYHVKVRRWIAYFKCGYEGERR
jgi:hypothetical protein